MEDVVVRLKELTDVDFERDSAKCENEFSSLRSLLSQFIDDPKNDNIKDGEQSEHDNMADDTNEYHLYIVWKKKPVVFRKG